MLSRVLIAGQRERDNIRVAAAGTVLNVALNLLLIPRWGAVGAAASSLATIIMALIITAVLIHRQLFRLDMGKTFGKALLALLPVAVLALYAERTAWPPLIHWLLLPLLIGVYLGLLWWTRVLPRKIIAVAKQELGSRLGRKLSARDVRTSGKEVPEP
jgi:O-antigen/teichoic acid export membrane protein